MLYEISLVGRFRTYKSWTFASALLLQRGICHLPRCSLPLLTTDYQIHASEPPLATARRAPRIRIGSFVDVTEPTRRIEPTYCIQGTGVYLHSDRFQSEYTPVIRRLAIYSSEDELRNAHCAMTYFDIDRQGNWVQASLPLQLTVNAISTHPDNVTHSGMILQGNPGTRGFGIVFEAESDKESFSLNCE